MTGIGDEIVQAVQRQLEIAAKRQLGHIKESKLADRTNWTKDQWVDDARELMNDIDGSVLDLLNEHVMAMLSKIEELSGKKQSS